MRDPSLLVYFRPDVGGLVAGATSGARPRGGWTASQRDFNAKLLPEDWPGSNR
jgi:hypothetical protein